MRLIWSRVSARDGLDSILTRQGLAPAYLISMEYKRTVVERHTNNGEKFFLWMYRSAGLLGLGSGVLIEELGFEQFTLEVWRLEDHLPSYIRIITYLGLQALQCL